MKGVMRHFSKMLIAGIVALLPIGGTILGIVYLESELAEAWNGVKPLRGYYFPGLGIVAVVLIIYATGLLVSTFLGRFVWKLFDGVLTRLPLLGSLYDTLKQILGYDVGEDAIFQRVVFVRDPDVNGEELGLVTSRPLADGRLLVFIPGSPMPTSGRLLVVSESATRAVDMTVNDALSALVALGKTDAMAEQSSA